MNTVLKDGFDQVQLIDLWLSCQQECPLLAQKAIKSLIHFVTNDEWFVIFSLIILFFHNKFSL